MFNQVRYVGIFLSIILLSCSSKKLVNSEYSHLNKSDDSYLWLEEIESPSSLRFAESENTKTLAVLKNDPNFKKIENETRKILLAQDRIPWANLMNGKLYNFWQDKDNVKGIWRRTDLRTFKSENPNWETVLDLDKLAKKENENWVWKGANCFPPKYVRCLVSLSKGGKDARVIREFDILNYTAHDLVFL